ncbi:NAD(P)H-quinone oxidoreductase [Croceibacterium sp. TMG7-5b_MA50]|uniref:NAD(P)H-quinone oxidoreductase n=1 Tax=Croceibacterium sp. TMG7-5b_MA50 TaxID=3121290 RepID=UPI00322154FB
MIAITIDAAAGGAPEALVPTDAPVPVPGVCEVLIRVAHAGVNRPDVLQRQGNYPPPPGASEIPGLEIAGTVVALGEGADPALLGQVVCALLPGGGYAEYAAADAGLCLPVPAGLSLAEAAALPETVLTVWHNVWQRGAAQPGQRLLVHGGTSGIGTTAIMLGALKGMEVFTTCGSDDKCAAALEIGADHAINYRTADFAERVLELTDGEGVDVVLDMVAGSYTQRNLDCMAPDGRLVTIATLGGAKVEVNMAKVMVKRHTLTGSTLRARPVAFKAALVADVLQQVWPFVVDGALRPVMDEGFPLAQAAAAHRRMEAGDHVGKIVLNMAPEGTS